MVLLKCRLGMELHQLRYLVMLADERNFTRAARRSNVAQPALSRQIRKLEDELGVPLVDRTTRRATLTPVGIDVVERARRALVEVDEIRSAVRDAVALLTGRITIGLTQTPGPIDAAAILGAFHARHPAVELALREGLSVALADRLRADELDLAFVSRIDEVAARGLELHRLAAEPLVLIVSKRHPLAARKRVRVQDLKAERFIAFPAGATIRATFERVARDAGFRPDVALESTDIARTRALVAEGLGVALLPQTDAKGSGPEVQAVRVSGRVLTHQVLLATRAGRRLAPAAAGLVRVVHESLSRASTPST
jgi:LysR family transcriptional activator of glutamate synthase operon